MKKLALVALISGITILTACTKPVTEVKKGESEINVKATKAESLSVSNKADIEADLALIRTHGSAQELKAAPLQQRMNEAFESKDQEKLKTLFVEFRHFVDQSNTEMNAIPLKSSEISQLRSKMIETTLLGLQMSEIVVSQPMEQINEASLQPLQQKLVQNQQELMAITQDIQQKIGVTPTPSEAQQSQIIAE